MNLIRFRQILVIVPLTWLIGSPALAKIEYKSRHLNIKDSEEVTALVHQKIRDAQSTHIASNPDDVDGIFVEPRAVEKMKDGMRIILSRRDSNGTLSEVFGHLRQELRTWNSFESTVSEIASEAIEALKNRATPVEHQVTYIQLLENLMAEVRPDLDENRALRNVVEKIRDADIQIFDKLKSHQLLNSMSEPVSPSETARKLMSHRNLVKN